MTQSKSSFVLNNIFSGLRSRCIIFFSCIYWIPSSKPLIIVFICIGVNNVFACIKCKKYFDTIIQLSSFKQLEYHVNSVISFEDLVQVHVIFMSKFSHNFYFFHKTLFSIIFAISRFFWKCFYCIFFTCFDLLYHKYLCKAPFSYFLYCFILFMKTSLIQKTFKYILPSFRILIAKDIWNRFIKQLKCNDVLKNCKFDIELELYAFSII